MEESGEIHLTEAGYERATQIYERHRLITKYLVNALQIDEKVAVADACRIEHVISQESFQQIKKWVEKNCE